MQIFQSNDDEKMHKKRKHCAAINIHFSHSIHCVQMNEFLGIFSLGKKQQQQHKKLTTFAWHTQWQSNGIMCCNYRVYNDTDLIIIMGELTQRTVMVDFIACLKITKITKLK